MPGTPSNPDQPGPPAVAPPSSKGNQLPTTAGPPLPPPDGAYVETMEYGYQTITGTTLISSKGRPQNPTAPTSTGSGSAKDEDACLAECLAGFFETGRVNCGRAEATECACQRRGTFETQDNVAILKKCLKKTCPWNDRAWKIGLQGTMPCPVTILGRCCFLYFRAWFQQAPYRSWWPTVI
jgi:hypothetical protein